MNKKDFIKDIIVDFHTSSLTGVKSRSINIPINTNKIITLIGPRRSGKTYSMLDKIQELYKTKVSKEKILYFNLEDERLNFERGETELILQSYTELYPEIDLSGCYFFFDEIQNMPDWEKFIRRIYDSVSKNVFVTGSNSSFLSSDIATALRGRTIKTEVFPLSFKEYLNFLDITSSVNGAKNKAILKNKFKDYLIKGGYPETIEMDDDIREKTLQEYYYVLLYKDLIERYNISNTQVLKYFLKRLVSNLSSLCSINKIYNEIKSSGYKVPKNLIYDIFDWSESVFFSFKLSKFSRSIIKQNNTEKKVYIIDNGLVNTLSFSFFNDYGKLLENSVFLYLRRKYENNMYFYKNQSECDFVVFSKDKVSEIIQVCYDIGDDKTFQREIKGLLDACKFFKMKEGTIVTLDEEKELQIDKILIKIIPAYKFFLQ